jgi:hypothetical protein
MCAIATWLMNMDRYLDGSRLQKWIDGSTLHKGRIHDQKRICVICSFCDPTAAATYIFFREGMADVDGWS